MKKPVRITIRVAGALGALAVVLGVVSLGGVDSRPYFREPYYAETKARLGSPAETNSLVRGDLSAGFGRALLSPSVNADRDDPRQGKFHMLPLAGYGNRHGRPATGVHDDLYVKAIAFRVGDRVGVMAGADALIIPREVAEMALGQIRQELGLAREQVYLGATHTHCSLGGWGEGTLAEAFAGHFQPGARTWFADRIAAAVREAVQDIRPAAYGSGRFAAPEFIRSRLVGGLGKVDPEFSYAVIKQTGGKLAVLGVYGAHATILSGDMMEFSADYPGSWARAMEQATGGMAVFLAGGVGSHSPVPGGKGTEGAERMGKALADALLARLPSTPLTNSVVFGLRGLDVTMPPLNVRVADGVRLRPWLAGRLVQTPGRTFLQVFRLNDSLWISTPCDFSGELALGIKDFLLAKGCHATLTSFNGDYVGYVIPSRYYHLDGYEPRMMSFFGPNVPDYFDELIRDMSLRLAVN